MKKVVKTQSKTATFVKALHDFTGKASLYKLSEPVKYYKSTSPSETNFVIVSATRALFSGPETYIFPADENGYILNWGELEGSFRGALDHEHALMGAGFTVRG